MEALIGVQLGDKGVGVHPAKSFSGHSQAASTVPEVTYTLF